MNTTTGIEPVRNQIPENISLYQNYPNPFNPVTKIKYDLPITNYVKLAVYDILGREVAVLFNEKQTAGKHEIKWDASNFSSGVYFYKLTSGVSKASEVLKIFNLHLGLQGSWREWQISFPFF